VKIFNVVVTPPVYSASGAVTAGLMLSQALSKKIPVEVLIIGDGTKNYAEFEGVKVVEFFGHSVFGRFEFMIPRVMRNAFITSNSLLKYIASNTPDLVHVHNPHPIQAFCDIVSVCKRLGIPIVASSHGFVEFSDPSSWLKSQLKRFAFKLLVTCRLKKTLKKINAIFFTSPQEVQLVANLKIGHIPRYIVTNGYNKQFEDYKITRKTKSASGDVVFFFLANHTPNKGLDLLIEAVSLSNRGWKLIVGGKIRDINYISYLCKKFSVPMDGGRILFTDYLTDHQLLLQYNQADAFVLPTRVDTLPLVILDAMAVGLPVVSTRVGGIAHMVNESSGVLIENGDVKELTLIMDKWSENPILLKNMGLSGYQRVREIFDWNVIADEAIKNYTDILKNKDALNNATST
jgi:glycosyltransferase involved in cell wall biosynthesis